MQVSVKGKQVSVGAALRDRVAEKLTDRVRKYFDNPIEAQVVISREAQHLRADVSVHVGRGILLQGHATADDPYAAFEVAEERIAKRLRRHKRRLRERRELKPEKDVAKLFAQQYVLAGVPIGADETEDEIENDIEDDTEDENEPGAGAAEANDGAPVVIAETTTEIDTLTVGEAVMRMDLADLPALVFRNRGHGRLNVVYRRPDGNVGWIDPDAADAGEKR